MSSNMDVIANNDLTGVGEIKFEPPDDHISDSSQTDCLMSNKLTKSQSQQFVSSVGADRSRTETSNEISGVPIEDKKFQQLSQQSQQYPTQDQQFQLPEEFRRDVEALSRFRNRWYTNEEVACILTNFPSHPEWQTNELQVRPKSGAVFLYSREKVRYRQDGYCWKKRKNGRTTREDHMKLKVQGIECIYGCYVHSAILPTFHRRCYWLLQNPDVVLVHYLNQPPDDQNKMLITLNPSSLEVDTRRTWTHEEIIQEIGSVFGGISQIQHMLNKNFPPSTKSAILNQIHREQQSHQDVPAITTNTSPQSQHSQATSNSEAMIEQVDMAIVDSQQQQLQSQNQADGSRDMVAEDEAMAISQDSVHEHIENQQPSADDPNELSCLGIKAVPRSNGHEHLHHQSHHHDQQNHSNHDISTCMKFVNECENGQQNNLANNSQSSVDCFVHASGSNVNSMNVSVDVIDNNNNSNDMKGALVPQGKQLTSSGVVGQNPCSPVTQIYNKIVDDIESYALPLEPNQFDPGHHHHVMSLGSSSLPAQSMDIGDGSKHHPSLTQLGHHNHLQHHADGSEQMDQQFLGPEKENSVTCSIDMATCDLFCGPAASDDSQLEHPTNRIESHHQRVVSDSDQNNVVGDSSDNLLLSEFNLQSNDVGHVNDDIGTGCVADSLTGVDDLRDLIMGISSNENAETGNPLLVDTNSLDIFSFKADCKQRDQHMDFKSSISETDTMNRFSPLIPVPRCNSTGNAMQPLTGQHHNYQLQPQHLSNQLLSCSQDNQTSISNFNGFHSAHNSHRSSSTNPTNSTSCSPTPSTPLIQAGLMGSPIGTSCMNSNSHYANQTASTSHSFIKLPLQQRQRSEQQEPSNVVVTGLLPKAVSLDGGDLSSTRGGHRMLASPLTSNNVIQTEDACGRHKNSNLVSPKSIMTDNLQSQHLLASSVVNHTGVAQLCSLLSPGVQSNSTEVLMGGAKPECPSNSNQRNSFQGFQAYGVHDTICLAPNEQHSNCLNQSRSECEKLLKILDYSPTWSNVTGGAKVLIIGDWISLLSEGVSQEQNRGHISDGFTDDSSHGFFAVFDSIAVPATLIADNVLRCFAPGHEEGKIFLKVLHKNQVVTEPVIFEMRPLEGQSIDQSSSNNNPGDNQGRGSDSSNENTSQTSNTQQQHHRNSTSSNQSSSSMSSFSNYRPHESSSSANSMSSLENPVITNFADNLKTAIRQKKGTYLMGSLEVESIEPRSPHQRQLSLRVRGPIQRRLTIVNDHPSGI